MISNKQLHKKKKFKLYNPMQYDSLLTLFLFSNKKKMQLLKNEKYQYKKLRVI
jgi:hypothetical protein